MDATQKDTCPHSKFRMDQELGEIHPGRSLYHFNWVCVGHLSMSLDLDPRKTALVLIDLQRGVLERPGAPRTSSEVLRHAVALAQACVEAQVLIVRVHVAFASDFSDMPGSLVDSPIPRPPGGLPAGWSDFAPEVAALPAAIEITKRHWSAFHGTELDLQLRRRGLNTIVLAGIATNFGVESTARDAWQHNYAVVIAEDATTSFDAEMHRLAIEKILPRVSRVRSAAEIIAALRR